MGKREAPSPRRQRRQGTDEPLRQAQQHQKEHHEPAHPGHGGHRPLHRPKKLPRQSGPRRHRPFRHGGDGQWAAAEQQTRQQRGGAVQQIQPGSRPGAAEYRHPGHADGKGRAGVVTERQQPRPLGRGQLPPAHQLRRRPRPHRIAAPRRRSGRAARRGVPAPGLPPPPPPAPPAGTRRQKTGTAPVSPTSDTAVRRPAPPGPPSPPAAAAVSPASRCPAAPTCALSSPSPVPSLCAPPPGNTPPRTGKFRCVRA